MLQPIPSGIYSGGVGTGPNTFTGVQTFNAGTNTAGTNTDSAPLPTTIVPALGVSFVPCVASDCDILCVGGGTSAGFLSYTYGPVTGAEYYGGGGYVGGTTPVSSNYGNPGGRIRKGWSVIVSRVSAVPFSVIVNPC